MNGPVNDEVRIKHILDAIAEVESYLHEVSFNAFVDSSEKRFATIKQIEIIGEACRHISDIIKQAHTEIDWRSINGFRNISIHEYFSVNFHLVWEIAQTDLPLLKESFSSILANL